MNDNELNMKNINYIFIVLIVFSVISCGQMNQNKKRNGSKEMMIRIAEIEVDSVYLDKFIAILKTESEASVRLEPGVICIYPMFQKENPTRISLLEIYENKAAYASHLQTPHFQHYKTTTLDMVKSLKLVDMEAIDAETMSGIFKKMSH
jgi:quinol monooxygenase YgiN